MSIPTYPVLYTVQNNNKVYEWSIKIEKTITNTYTITTSHGQKDGKIINHTTEIKEGKANRSTLEQAILESNRKWENKKTKEQYSETIQSQPSQVRPMLANKFTMELYKKGGRAFKIEFPAFAQRKYDGIRCLSYIKNGEVVLESRKGTVFENFSTLKTQLKSLFKNCPPNFYFDGELYTQKIPFETISGLIRLTEKKALPEDIKMIEQIEYHIYDIYDANTPSTPYKERYVLLDSLLHNKKEDMFLCKRVETIKVNTVEEFVKYHDVFVNEGYEGIMLRDIVGPYEPNKRSKYLQKYKTFMEEEFTVVGYHDGVGDESGAIIWDCKTKEGKTFAVRPKGTVESRKKLFIDGDKYVNKLLTVIFQEYSVDGIPRFPVGKAIREDL
jgi:ATP-dependent DNA ligase